MSKQPASVWRVRARRIIEGVLDDLPLGGSSDKPLVRRRLREAYPFGQRTGWPYHQWCVEQAAAFRRLFPEDPSPCEKYETGLTLKANAWPPWIVPYCGWCNSGKAVATNGCLMCGRTLERLHAIVDSVEWLAWRDAMRTDIVAALACADWLDERDICDVAELLREAGFSRLAETEAVKA